MERLCDWCDQVYEAKTKELKRGQGRFHSRACAAAYGNSLKPPGMSKTKAGRLARQIWIERHDGEEPMCRICGKPADIHHKDGKHFNNDPDNHDPLCRSHHVAHENGVKPKRQKRFAGA